MSAVQPHLSPAPSIWCCPRCRTALQPGSRFCQACGTTLMRAPRPKLFIAQRILLVLGWLACLVAWLLLFWETESVVGTGPVILLLGLALIFVGAVSRHYLGALIGAAHGAVCILFLTLVIILRWSPHAAHLPFLIMGLLYLVAITPLTIWAFLQRPHARPPSECQICGYLLFGLTEPRCPECGTPFDPTRLKGLTPPDQAAVASTQNP